MLPSGVSCAWRGVPGQRARGQGQGPTVGAPGQGRGGRGPTVGARRVDHLVAVGRGLQPDAQRGLVRLRREGAIQKSTRVLISLWDALMFARVPGTRPNNSESHSEMSTRVPFCIASIA